MAKQKKTIGKKSGTVAGKGKLKGKSAKKPSPLKDIRYQFDGLQDVAKKLPKSKERDRLMKQIKTVYLSTAKRMQSVLSA